MLAGLGFIMAVQVLSLGGASCAVALCAGLEMVSWTDSVPWPEKVTTQHRKDKGEKSKKTN